MTFKPTILKLALLVAFGTAAGGYASNHYLHSHLSPLSDASTAGVAAAIGIATDRKLNRKDPKLPKT